jgi:purine-nucleoside phosphorylase
MRNEAELEERLEDSRRYLRKAIPARIRTAVVLGSGLERVKKGFEILQAFSYQEIPHFPVSSVSGHKGELLLAKRGPRRLLIMNGRVHHYEGYSFTQVCFPVMVLRRLGVSSMIITNAAGAVSGRVVPGDIMIIKDHIDLIWKGMTEFSRGPQTFRREYYSKRMSDLAYDLGLSKGIPVKRGVLLATAGPSYETKSEVEFTRQIGADAVTMSTVPEVTACHEMGIAVLGMSMITNVAASHEGGHEMVVDFAARSSEDLRAIILEVADVI